MVLLTLWLATPAIALPACHWPPPAAMAQMDMDHTGHDRPTPAQHPQDDMRVSHPCLGCALPDSQTLAIARPLLLSARHWLPPVKTARPSAPLPETPPPRG